MNVKFHYQDLSQVEEILKEACVVFVVGASGGGKDYMLEKLGLQAQCFSTGDYFRAQSKKNAETKNTVNSGGLMPDEETCEIVAREIAKIVGVPYVNGFPRSIPQADESIAKYKNPIVLYRNTSRETCEKRSADRVICEDCGKTYSLTDHGSDKCTCGGNLIRREDEAKSKERLDLFYNEIIKVIPYYIEQGVLVIEVDGDIDFDEILTEVQEKLKPLLER